MNLNSTDIQVRIYLINCKIGELSTEYAEDLRLGRKCALKHRNELLILEGVLEILKCYSAIQENINMIGSMTITDLDGATAESTIQMTVGGDLTPISEVIALGEDSLDLWVAAIADSINSYQNIYTAISDSGILTITGPCDAVLLSEEFGGQPPLIENVDFSGGICEVTESDNCYTEEEIQELLDDVSKKYNICFQPIGFSYQ